MQTQQSFYEWMDYAGEMFYRPTVSQSTFEVYGYYVRIIKKYLDDCPLQDITTLKCQRVLNRLYEDGYAKGSIKKCITILTRTFSLAVANHLIAVSPMVGYTVPNAPTKKVTALKQRQQEMLEIYCQSVSYGDYMLFLLYTGLRVGEMIALQWSDFDPIEKAIYVRKAKTPSGIRTVPLIPKTYNIIIAQPHYETDEYIFHNKHGRPISYSSMKKCYEQLRQKTGLTEFTNHVCRHSFATRLTERGAQPKAIAGLLGHKKAEFAMNIYTDVEQETLKQEIYLLSGKLVPKEITEQALTACLQFIRRQNGEIPLEILHLLETRS